MENIRKTQIGKVVSNVNDKTITIVSETKLRHSLYGKFVRRSKKYAAHDEKNECQLGDLVKIVESRPLSKSKRWSLLEIVEKAK